MTPTQIWVVLLTGWSKFPSRKTNQEHNQDLGSDASSVWNFSARFSDVISRKLMVMLRNVGCECFLELLRCRFQFWSGRCTNQPLENIRPLECGRIELVTVLEAILKSRQPREKLQCLYENLMSNNFRQTAVLKKIINCKLKLHSKGFY